MSEKRSALNRTGFTLVELLVVLAIIAALVGLTTAAVMQVADNQRAANTESLMRTVSKALDQQWRAVLETADRESIPASVITMAGTDANSGPRARVIWRCLRLMQEFPMSFAEAQNPGGGAIPELLPKSAYKSAAGAGIAPEVQNSACLLLALQQGRGSSALMGDSIAGNIAPTGVSGLSQIVDGYGNPLVIFRFPTGNTELAGVVPYSSNNGKNPAKQGSRGFKYRNPLDPEGTLMDSAWNNGSANVTQFESLCFAVHDASGPISTYMVPTLVSAGRNKLLGLDLGVANALGTMNTMASTPADTAVSNNQSNDNIYSFRLGIDKRGD